jgi:hypothetical protein
MTEKPFIVQQLEESNYMTHRQDPDLWKHELLWLFGGEDNMLSMDDDTLDWIRSLPDTTRGQWVWDNAPDPLFYTFIEDLNIWGYERHLTQDWWNISAEVKEICGDDYFHDTYSEWYGKTMWDEIRELPIYAEYMRLLYEIDGRYDKLEAFVEDSIGFVWLKVSELWATNRPLHDKWMESRAKLIFPHRQKQRFATYELKRLFNSSGTLKTVENKWAQKVRDLNVLPAWEDVRWCLRLFFLTESYMQYDEEE